MLNSFGRFAFGKIPVIRLLLRYLQINTTSVFHQCAYVSTESRINDSHADDYIRDPQYPTETFLEAMNVAYGLLVPNFGYLQYVW